MPDMPQPLTEIDEEDPRFLVPPLPQKDSVRQFIADRCREVGKSPTAISRAMGRQYGWLGTYLTKGIPRLLTFEQRMAIARELDVEEAVLRAPGQVGFEEMQQGVLDATGVRTVRTADAAPSPAPIAAKRPPAPQTALMPTTADVPVFGAGDKLDPRLAQQWLPRPVHAVGRGGMIAIAVDAPSARTRIGDLLFVVSRRPRAGDLAVAVRGLRVVAIGEVVSITAETAHLDTGPGAVVFDLMEGGQQLMKVTGITTA